MSKMHTGKINIAFDGNVFVGKTTFLKKLAKEKSFNYIPEHSDFLKVSNSAIEHRKTLPAAHLDFVRSDFLRIEYLKDGVNLLDRSFVSFSAFTYAFERMGQLDMRENFLGLLQDMLQKQRIVIPTHYIHLKSNYEIARQRFVQNKKQQTPDFLIEKFFFDYFDLYCKRWIQKAGGKEVEILDENESIEALDFISTPPKLISNQEIFRFTSDLFY
ncbi:hypothetical protein COT78_03220 [Candidatus Berkelbacteria bacterium CG10_big_fil_rev_8_21_14_0_10_43_13]|uniref:Uncharacterized protein n=1 Tax=Candidatus Berkelbacteria bacterium CG10_big_fil_rev_8_21_14_0_10_43_13 TaxID=1974514 RepID=A0A2H0W608_9BACT|nr:MAG: hypothetical protein COT78_03220 [Candidatus Berkelbacteria bacterium CG10_big_fil_rev_8_21_14_0_10_43_13]